MFAKTIIDSDAFIDMPVTARLLYYDLGMRADDDGFVNSPRKIMRIIGASLDDLNILCAKKFIIPFSNGVIVIKHWRINNSIQADRYHETKYAELKAQLVLDENKSYRLLEDPMYTTCIQDGYKMDTQVRLGKDSVDREIYITDSSSLSLDEDSKKKRSSKKVSNEKFERFYQAYPKKVSKDYALKCFEKINPDDELLETMLKAIERQKMTRQWQDKQYIPNPSTWLNQGKWKDEIPDDALVGHAPQMSQKASSSRSPKSHYNPDGTYDYQSGLDDEWESL